MDSLVFFGSLRSKKLLKIVIESDLSHLEFFDAKIFGSKLYKVKDENFPFLQRTDSSNDFIDCTYIKGLTKENFEKIMFYESVEYEINQITISVDKKNIKTNYFKLIKKNKSSELWFFENWERLFEKFSCIAAKQWMLLFLKYKDNPIDAEFFWQEMLEKAKEEVNK